jgi:mRNA-degrading endonuclease RelE of RelBE toxin-antitoxin system
LRGGGAYRAVYVVLEEHHTCLVFIVGPHENTYDKAERRLAALRRAGRI